MFYIPSGKETICFCEFQIIWRDFWGAVLRDCTNVLTSAVSAFAQIPVPEALAIAGSADEHQRLHLDQSGRFWIEAWTDYVGDQPRAEWLSHEEAARWYATAHYDWRCGLSDAQGLVSIHRSWRGELHREFLAKVKPDLVAARDEVYTELRRETVQQEIQQQQQQKSVRRC